ncbi:MAG: pyridoxine 5'-phosphate synthase [Deltaproteobacteria bacterium]|nr:pyridoxine 5'-phosphate synthase [Deltaproteobacteria bacterium]
MRPKLGVNIDHVATLRQVRMSVYPDPVHAAVLCELGGADGITVHLREDRRHIQERDVKILRQIVKTKLNLEMAATKEMVEIALDIRPDSVCLVPEKRAELTTEGGLNVVESQEVVRDVVKALKNAGIEVSIFIDPDLDQISMAKRCDTDAIELHTGKYCDAPDKKHREYELSRLIDAAKAASKMGLKVNAGHGLNYQNIFDVASIEEIEEFNIGHSIVARSIYVGLERAVREMVELLRFSRQSRANR